MYGSTTGRSSGSDEMQTFSSLCLSVGSQVQKITSKAGQLDKCLKMVGSKNDRADFRQNIHKLELETNEIVHETTQNIKMVSDIARKGDRGQKLQADKLRSDFQDAIRFYTSLQQQIATKIKYTTPVVKEAPESNPFADNFDPYDPAEERKRQMQEDDQAQANIHAQIVERDAAVLQIQSDVLDINEIMRDIGNMVQVQTEVVDNIENNIENAYGAINEAESQLQEAKRYQRKARKKAICITATIIIILGILALVIYFSVKH